MVHVWLGRSGAGKSTEILRRIASSKGERRQILIVPDQASHEMERNLCAMAGNQVSLYAEVISFTRLANRVFAEAGGLATPTLDAGGRILLMASALKMVGDKLSVYQKPSKKPAFLTGLLATMDECKQYQIPSKVLSSTGDELEGEDGAKFRDLGLIFGAYESLCAQTAVDPLDRMTRLANGLKNCEIGTDADIYLDGFTDFTPQQGQVLRVLMRKANSFTVAITGDQLEGDSGYGVFLPAQKTVRHIGYLAKQERIEMDVRIIDQTDDYKEDYLRHVERNLFAVEAQVHHECVDGIELYRAETPRSEIERIASEILRLVREEGHRFRDIAVVGRGFETYSSLADEIFRRYDIPVFMDDMTDVLQKPAFVVITAALDVVVGNYSYVDMFRYLKTGLTSMTREQCDVLENYVVMWNIRGKQWSGKKQWDMHPRGYGAPWEARDHEVLRELNALKERVMKPLLSLQSEERKTGGEQAVALYGFMEEIQLAQQLETRGERLRECGELRAAEEDGQLWDILCGGLEQCAHVLHESVMALDEFVQLFKLVLSQYEVGSIPVSLDRVTVGDASRLGNKCIKTLFFLGADESAIPQVTPSGGLFTDDDRSLLASYQLEVGPMVEDKLDREMTIVYLACARPSQRLVISWSSASAQGEEKTPSILVQRMREIFPANKVIAENTLGKSFRFSAPKVALEMASHSIETKVELSKMDAYSGYLERMEWASELERGHLARPVVDQLYGKRVPMSASRMDKYKSCHFSYFMQYGLRLKPRMTAGFSAPEYGTFVHYVLEHILQDESMMDKVNRPSQSAIDKAVAKIFDTYIETELGGLENKTARFVYLFKRLVRPITNVVKHVLEEMWCSEFEPIAFELGFGVGENSLPPVEVTVDGVTISVSGLVDRVDGWVKDDKMYLRIVDYKTGKKAVDFSDMWHGIGLQMLLYLFTLEKHGKAVCNYEVTPAGILYVPAREAVVQGSPLMTDVELDKEVRKQLERKGLLLHDGDVLDAMEPLNGAGPKFLPLKVSGRTGLISGDALVSAAQLGKLKKHTMGILDQIGREMAQGNINADPYWHNKDVNACTYCDYKAACHFEDKRCGDGKRYAESLKAEAFWGKIEESQKDDEV